jgi:hypothetical protein
MAEELLSIKIREGEMMDLIRIKALAMASYVLALIILAGCTPSRVRVVNEPVEPVPVTGEISAVQTGAWVVGVNPAQNDVVFHLDPAVVLFDSGLLFVNDGDTVELGPVDLSEISIVRILTQGVNGEVRFHIIADLPGSFPLGPMTLEKFNLGSEGEAEFSTKLYELPGPGLRFRITEVGGPGGANARVAVLGPGG